MNISYISAVGLTLSDQTKHDLRNIMRGGPIHFDLDEIRVPLAYFQGPLDIDYPELPELAAFAEGFQIPYSAMHERSDLILGLDSPALLKIKRYFVQATNGLSTIYTPPEYGVFALFKSPSPPLSRTNRGWITNMSTTLRGLTLTLGRYDTWRIL